MIYMPINPKNLKPNPKAINIKIASIIVSSNPSYFKGSHYCLLIFPSGIITSQINGGKSLNSF